MGKKIIVTSILVAAVALLSCWLLVDKVDNRLVFDAEWYDPLASSVRHFKLSFFPEDTSVEIFDSQSKRTFLKRIVIPAQKEENFYVGNTVVIYSRQIKLTGYANEDTKVKLESCREKTFAMIKPDGIQRMGEIIQQMNNEGFIISQMKMIQLTRVQAAEFYQEHEKREFFDSLLDYITSGYVVAIELISYNAVSRWRESLGPTDAVEARHNFPSSIRAKFGTDKQVNAAHGSDSSLSANRELDFFFPSTVGGFVAQSSAQFSYCTCAIVKPHAIAKGHLGQIISEILRGNFKVTAMQLFRLNKVQAEEFYEVYKGVLPEYPGMVQELIQGPCVAMEISSDYGSSTPSQFREFVGPSDPKVAKELRPGSIRSLYGEDKIRNAIHVSDLPEDGILEVEYFFKILQ